MRRTSPVLAFCLVGGLFGVLVDDAPATGRVFGIMFAAALIPCLLVVLTTWFELGDGVVLASVWAWCA